MGWEGEGAGEEVVWKSMDGGVRQVMSAMEGAVVVDEARVGRVLLAGWTQGMEERALDSAEGCCVGGCGFALKEAITEHKGHTKEAQL